MLSHDGLHYADSTQAYWVLPCTINIYHKYFFCKMIEDIDI